jgi:hypothetical protein
MILAQVLQADLAEFGYIELEHAKQVDSPVVLSL